MSRIYFHSLESTVAVGGRERHRFGGLCINLTLAILEPATREYGEASVLRKAIPVEMRGWSMPLDKTLEILLFADDRQLNINGLKISGFTFSLNTALSLGNDAVKLAARLHGQCEVHAFVEGPNREWLAGVIDNGLASGLYGPDEGWQEVMALLRSTSDGPVVTSYSVTDQFPNCEIAGRADKCDDFCELPYEQQWEIALQGLRELNDGRELTPDRWQWPDFWFEPRMNAQLALRALREA